MKWQYLLWSPSPNSLLTQIYMDIEKNESRRSPYHPSSSNSLLNLLSSEYFPTPGCPLMLRLIPGISEVSSQEFEEAN